MRSFFWRTATLSFVPLLSSAVLMGCAHTRISARDIPQDATKLAGLNSKSISIAVDCPVDEIVGHQYLFIIFPFGRISIEHPGNHLRNHLYVAMAEAGLKPLLVNTEQADLRVTCNVMSLTAYDLLFVRRIVAALQVTLSLPGIGSQRFTTVRDFRLSATKPLAFYQQLEYLLHQLFTEAATEIARSVQ